MIKYANIIFFIFRPLIEKLQHTVDYASFDIKHICMQNWTYLSRNHWLRAAASSLWYRRLCVCVCICSIWIGKQPTRIHHHTNTDERLSARAPDSRQAFGGATQHTTKKNTRSKMALLHKQNEPYSTQKHIRPVIRVYVDIRTHGKRALRNTQHCLSSVFRRDTNQTNNNNNKKTNNREPACRDAVSVRRWCCVVYQKLYTGDIRKDNSRERTESKCVTSSQTSLFLSK